MSTSCGFFNSLNGDRRYNATHLGKCFEGIIRDGVLASIGDCFIVKANSGMTITVGSGKSWYLASWLTNDADLPMTHEPSDVVLGRIDAVVMEFNMSENVRRNDIKIIKGTSSSIPTIPVLENTNAVKQVPLAFVNVRANTATITQADIVNMVGTSDCPFVTGILETIDTDELIVQWQYQFEKLFAQLVTQIDQAVRGSVIDGAVSSTYFVTIPVMNWEKGEFDYYQQIEVAGMLDTDEPIVDLNFPEGNTDEANLELEDNYGIYRCVTFNDGILVRSRELPECDIPIKLKCIRK